jgi:peptidylprolyl isomerase
MDKRFLYIILIIVIILVVVLAMQDYSKNSPSSITNKLNVTPTVSLSNLNMVGGQNPTSPTPVPAQNQPTSSPAAAIDLGDGLKIQDLKEGIGKEVKNEDTIAVNYIGYLESGKKFDSSYDRGTPLIIQIGVGQVIKGWDLGIIGMKEAGQRRVYVPSSLGYGEAGAGDSIPPNSNLIFDVELLSVK